jgi:RNA polymerase sigma factor (sigma-70 family)
VTRNRALNARKRQSTRVRREGESVTYTITLDDGTIDDTERMERDELARAVRQATASLSERSREVYLLSFHHGLTYREIAATLGVSPSTVQTHMARALAMLGRKLRPFLSLMLLLTR